MQPNQQDDSILSKSTTNITNISSLTNQSQTNNLNLQPTTTSEYENLSNLIDSKFYSSPVTVSKRNAYMTNSNNLLQLSSPPPAPRTTVNQNYKNSAPMPPPTLPPKIPTSQPIPTSIAFKLNPNNTDTDSESVMSCQLITSASLLLNRDSVREAKQQVKEDANGVLGLPKWANQRQTINSISSQTHPNQLSHPYQRNQQPANINQMAQHLQKFNLNSDVLKPPPLESTI